VAAAIADSDSNIDNVSMDEERGMYTTMQFTIQVQNRLHLARVMKSLRRIPQVVRLTRIKE
jgi:Guanosine polyphosphate pyrophosphohydrolases/synthetases